MGHPNVHNQRHMRCGLNMNRRSHRIWVPLAHCLPGCGLDDAGGAFGIYISVIILVRPDTVGVRVYFHRFNVRSGSQPDRCVLCGCAAPSVHRNLNHARVGKLFVVRAITVNIVRLPFVPVGGHGHGVAAEKFRTKSPRLGPMIPSTGILHSTRRRAKKEAQGAFTQSPYGRSVTFAW